MAIKLLSGRGHLVIVDPATGEKTIVYDRLPGFAHGMLEHRGILFVAVSKLRSRKMNRTMPIEGTGEELMAGILAFELSTHELLGTLQISAGIHEIYDLQLLPGIRNAEIQTSQKSLEHAAIDLPKGCFWATEPKIPAKPDATDTADDGSLSSGPLEADSPKPPNE